MDGRNSKDAQPQRPHDNPDIFDDDYALDEDDFMPSVSDGFRPGAASEGLDGDRQNHDRNEPARPQITTTQSTDSTDLRRVATRNSTAKVPFDQDPTSHAGRLANLHNRGPSSQVTPLHHRESVSSTASFATTTRPESPLGTGPSHPYGMYPQNTMARSSSIATPSIAQQHPQRTLSLQRPAHPYGMYPQNVVEDEEPVPVPQVQTIPVGFPGAATAYRRQIGPDGEEQDIIGLDGHTEQLPPYSRYPEEGPTKASMAAEASATSTEAVPNPLTASDDVPLADEAPLSPGSPVTPMTPVASVTPALLPPQRPETQTGSVAAPRPATNSESASLLTNEEGASEKAEPAKSVRKVHWRKKRLWGKIPVTVALILLALLLIFAVILGAAIGTFLAKQGRNKNKDNDNGNKSKNGKYDEPASQVSEPANSLFDATPITTSVSLAPLPTGDFFLPLGSAQESSPGCLTQGNQYSAWSCRMSFAPLVLTITASDPPTAIVEAFTAPDGAIQYGLQPPSVTNMTMQLVTDLDFKGYGPAWHFSTEYDKIVILTADEFAAGSSLRKRQGEKPFRHRFQVQPGDSPWVCSWNQTYIEGYIYAQDNSTAATIAGGFPTPDPTDPFGPTQTTDPTASASDIPPAPTSPQKRQDNNSPPSFPRLPPYPRIVKIEERRIPGAPQPLCQKMQLLENGRLAAASLENGGTVQVMLQEEDPDLDYWSDPPSPSEVPRRRGVEKRRDPSDSCHCQWMFQ